MNVKKDLICPIRDRECLGRKCAFAVFNPFIENSIRYWFCGLLNSNEVERALPHPVDWENRLCDEEDQNNEQ